MQCLSGVEYGEVCAALALALVKSVVASKARGSMGGGASEWGGGHMRHLEECLESRVADIGATPDRGDLEVFGYLDIWMFGYLDVWIFWGSDV